MVMRTNTTKQYVLAYVAALCAFFVLDFIWLVILTRDFYEAEVGTLMTNQPKLVPGIAFYFLDVIGVVVFAVAPALARASWRHALILGALFGFMTYATYDLTNLSLLRGWTTAVSLVDIGWGCCVTALSALAGFAAAGGFRRA